MRKKYEPDKTDAPSKLTYFLIGGCVGAAVALLLAPKSGKELRETLAGSAPDSTENFNTDTESAEESGSAAEEVTIEKNWSEETAEKAVEDWMEEDSAALEGDRNVDF